MPELNLGETWKVVIIESERGWGQKVEEVKFFDNQKDASKTERSGTPVLVGIGTDEDTRSLVVY